MREIGGMARPTSNPRVPTLDPHETTLAFVRQCVAHGARLADLLSPALAVQPDADVDVLVDTELYRRLRPVVDYAIKGRRLPRPLRELLVPLESLVASPLWERIDLHGVLASVDAQREASAIKLVLAAAMIRARLEDGESITTGEAAGACQRV